MIAGLRRSNTPLSGCKPLRLLEGDGKIKAVISTRLTADGADSRRQGCGDLTGLIAGVRVAAIFETAIIPVSGCKP